MGLTLTWSLNKKVSAWVSLTISKVIIAQNLKEEVRHLTRRLIRLLLVTLQCVTRISCLADDGQCIFSPSTQTNR